MRWSARGNACGRKRCEGRRVELAVFAVVDSVLTPGHVRTSWDGADTGEFGEHGFGLDALRVVVDNDQDLRNRINVDA